MKTVENVLFEENDIPCLVILHFKKKSSEHKCQFVSYNESTYTVLRKSLWWWGNWSCLLGEFQDVEGVMV